MNAPTYDDHGGELVWIFCSEVPAAIATHGDSCQIGALRIAVEFSCGGLQGGHGHIVHRRLDPPGILAALRHHDDSVEVSAVAANGGADADVGLVQTILAALARAVKKEDDRPFFTGRPIFGDEHLILVRSTL